MLPEQPVPGSSARPGPRSLWLLLRSLPWPSWAWRSQDKVTAVLITASPALAPAH